MSEAIGVVEQQIAAYRRANPSARALTDTQILSIMTQSGEIKKSEEADKGLAVERTTTPVHPTAVTPQQQSETSAEVQPMTKKEAEDTAIETIASNSAQALRTINNIDGGKISTTYNEIKEALHSELAESNVARVAYAQNESAELLRKAQNNELTYEEYCKRKKGVLLETFPLPNMTDKQKASVAKMVASLSPKETEEFLKKSLALPNPKAKNYKSKVNEFLNDFKMSTTEMVSNAQNGDKTGTLKSTTKTKTAYKLSGGKRLMTFDETYKSEMGVTFKKENIEAYNRSAATFAGVSKMTEKLDEIHKQLDDNITIVEGNNRNGVDSQTLETCNKRLEIGLNNSLRKLYGDDETAISKGLKDLTGENYSYKNGKLTMDVPANSGFAYTANGNDLVRLSKKVLKTVDENYQKTVGKKPLETYAKEMAEANKVAYGMKNAAQLADAYRADQEGVVHTVRAGVEYAGTAVMVAGMLCYPPVAFAGGAIASFGGVGVEMTEEATKQHTDPETMKALGEELATNAALMVVGMKAGQTGVAVKNALLAKNSPKLMATIADIGTDASISLMGDLALTGQVNLEGEGFSQVMSLIAGHRGKIVGGVKKIKEALKTPKAELEAPQPKAEVKPETEIPQPKAAEQALRDEIARQKEAATSETKTKETVEAKPEAEIYEGGVSLRKLSVPKSDEGFDKLIRQIHPEEAGSEAAVKLSGYFNKYGKDVVDLLSYTYKDKTSGKDFEMFSVEDIVALLPAYAKNKDILKPLMEKTKYSKYNDNSLPRYSAEELVKISNLYDKYGKSVLELAKINDVHAKVGEVDRVSPRYETEDLEKLCELRKAHGDIVLKLANSEYQGGSISKWAENYTVDQIAELAPLYSRDSEVSKFLQDPSYFDKIKKNTASKYQKDFLELFEPNKITPEMQMSLLNSGLSEADLLTGLKKLAKTTYRVAHETPHQYLSDIDTKYTTMVDGKLPALDDYDLRKLRADVDEFFDQNIGELCRASKYIDSDTMNHMMDKRTDEFGQTLYELNKLSDENYNIISDALKCKNADTGKNLSPRDKMDLCNLVQIYTKVGLDITKLKKAIQSGEISIQKAKDKVQAAVLEKAGVDPLSVPRTMKSFNEKYSYLALLENLNTRDVDNISISLKDQVHELYKNPELVKSSIAQTENALKSALEAAKKQGIEIPKSDLEFANQNIDILRNLDKYTEQEVYDRMMEGISRQVSQYAKSPELYTVIKEAAMGDFNKFITNPSNKYGNTNAATKAEYFMQGLHYDKWDNPELPDVKVQAGGKDMSIQLWERNPQEDLFMGNKTTCCTAIGTGVNGAATPTYLLNKAFNVVHLRDANGNVVGMSRVYMAKTDGKPTMIMDNIELNKTYVKGMPEEEIKKIRNGFFEYMNGYAQKVTGNADAKVLFYSQDVHVPTDDLHSVKKETEFIGDIAEPEVYINAALYSKTNSNGWINPKNMKNLGEIKWLEVPKISSSDPKTPLKESSTKTSEAETKAKEFMGTRQTEVEPNGVKPQDEAMDYSNGVADVPAKNLPKAKFPNWVPKGLPDEMKRLLLIANKPLAVPHPELIEQAVKVNDIARPELEAFAKEMQAKGFSDKQVAEFINWNKTQQGTINKNLLPVAEKLSEMKAFNKDIVAECINADGSINTKKLEAVEFLLKENNGSSGVVDWLHVARDAQGNFDKNIYNDYKELLTNPAQKRNVSSADVGHLLRACQSDDGIIDVNKVATVKSLLDSGFDGSSVKGLIGVANAHGKTLHTYETAIKELKNAGVKPQYVGGKLENVIAPDGSIDEKALAKMKELLADKQLSPAASTMILASKDGTGMFSETNYKYTLDAVKDRIATNENRPNLRVLDAAELRVKLAKDKNGVVNETLYKAATELQNENVSPVGLNFIMANCKRVKNADGEFVEGFNEKMFEFLKNTVKKQQALNKSGVVETDMRFVDGKIVMSTKFKDGTIRRDEFNSNMNKVLTATETKPKAEKSTELSIKAVDKELGVKQKLNAPDGRFDKATEQTKIVRDKDGKPIRYEHYTQSDVPGVFDVRVRDAVTGETKILSSGKVDKETGIKTVEKDMTSNDGTRTQYRYEDDPQGNRIIDYKITDKDGNVLMNDKQTFEVINENKFVSSHNGKVYDIEFSGDNLTIKSRNDGVTTEIELNKLITAQSDKAMLVNLLKQMPAEELISMKENVNHLESLKDKMRSNFDSPKDNRLQVGDDITVLEHELGHSKHETPVGQYVIEATPEIKKVYNEELEAFKKTATKEEQSFIDYFIDPKTHDSKPWLDAGNMMETIAESNSLLNNYYHSPELAMRAQYLQQHFPKTIAAISKVMNNGVEPLLKAHNKDTLITHTTKGANGKDIVTVDEQTSSAMRVASHYLHKKGTLAEPEIVMEMNIAGFGTGKNQVMVHRTKGEQSLQDKLENYAKDNAGKVKTLDDAIADVRDLVGTRTSVRSADFTKHPDVAKLIKEGKMEEAYIRAAELQSEPSVQRLKAVIDKQAKGTGLSIARLSNYMGQDGIPYLSERQLADLKWYAERRGVKLDYAVRADETDPMFAKMNQEAYDAKNPTKIRKSGYTALQINFKLPSGQIFEWQFRGDKVNIFAEAEHVPYDLRTGKDIIAAHPELEPLYKPMEKLLSPSTMSDPQFKKYNQYLTDYYKHLRKLELGFDSVEPKLSDYGDLDVRLSGKNLENLHLCAEDIKKHPEKTDEIIAKYKQLVNN